MKTLWHILLTTIAVFLTTQLTGQVTIQAALTPPYSPYFADYENQMILSLTNTSAQTVQVKLIGEITNQDDGNYVRTAPQYQPSQPIILQPNEIKTIFANQNHTGFLDKNNVETSYSLVDKATILASGQVPEGVYDFCVKALDYTTGAPLSQSNCQVISIGYPAPPIPIMPSCDGEVNVKTPIFGWLPPVGNFSNAQLRYDLMVVKLADGVDPNDAILFAIQGSNSQDLVQINDIATANFPYHSYLPTLIHNQRYVWAVRVKDLNNSVTFQNQGLSQVCTFTWKDPAIQFDGLHLPPLGTACQNDCAIDVLGEVDPHPTLAPNDIVKMGDFDLKIINFTVNSEREYDRFSGMGMINVPFLNGKLARLRVRFDTVVLATGTDRRVLSGTAKGMNNGTVASLIPDFNSPTWTGQTLSDTKLNTLDDYFKNLYANGENAVETIVNTVGWEMPMGIRKNGYTVAVTQINFAPNYARMNAMVVVPLPNYTPSVSALGLGVGDLCMTKDKFCKEGKVFLQQDFSIDVDATNPGNELIFKASKADSKELTGSYMLFDDKGIKHVHIDARYTLPPSKVLRADGLLKPLEAQLTLRADKVLDWMFMAQLDSFKVKGYKDLTFHADSMYVDLSDEINPSLPDSAIFFDINSDLTWKGFYAQRLNVSFAHGLTSKPTKFEIRDLIIDKDGVSANLLAMNLIDLNQGRMGSFNFTMDKLDIHIFKNSFSYGKITGAMRINIAAADFDAGLIDFTPNTKNNLIPYTALLYYKPALDPLPDGSYPPSKLTFDFVVQSNKTIDVPIWAATLHLLPTSVIEVSNKTGKFIASANLTGTFGFSAKIIAGIGAINCAGLKFQNWGISSDAPHFTNDPTFTLASPQKSLAGFPISLNSFKFVTQSSPKGPLFGLQFGINVKLADSIGEMPAASGRFSVFGRLDFTNGQAQPAFDHAEVNQICVSGKIAVVKLAGCVDFYSNDPKFGDGFRGQLDMELPGDIKVGATAQFGSVKNFRYWYADAIASPPAGSIPIFSGLELAGFGGGAYYHMKPKALPNMTVGAAAKNTEGVGMTPTGVVYEPDSTLNFGLKAKVYVASLKKRDVFNADAMLTIEFQNGTLGLIKVDGNARFISDKDMKGGAVTGSLAAGFDNTKGRFYANANLNASLANGLIQGNGSFDVHLEKGIETNNQLKWHLRFGRAPGSGTPININLAGLAKVETYFQAGNYQIDPMPAPSAFIADMFTTPEAKAMITNQRGKINLHPDSINIIHGGRFEANVDKEFLIFYGILKGGFGYDMLLMNNPAGCEGYPNPGIYGWYATGQAYAGLKGEIGLVVSMFGTKARYSIAEAHGAALVNAGFVNPTWAEGALTGGYSLFDGLVKGDYSYEFAVGDKCKEMNVNGLDKIDIIADVLPAASNNVEVSAAPSVSTSIQMNKNKIIDLVQTYNDGTSKHRLFRFDETLIKTEVRRNGVLMPVDSFERITSQDDYSFTLLPKKTLLKQTPYTFKVTVNIQECKAANVSYNAGDKLYKCNGGDAGWKLATKDNGEVWQEQRIVNFQTDNGLKSIQDGMVEYTTPYQMSRMHLQAESGTPRIVLSQTFEPLSYQFPANAAITYEARFIPLSNNSPMVKVNVPNIQGKKDITFNYPTTLTKGTYYAIQLIAKWTKAAGAPSPNPKDNFTDLKQKALLTNNSTLYATVNARMLNESKLAAVSSSEMKLYEIRFRTSQFNDYSNKLDNTVSEKVKYSVKKTDASNPQSVWVNEVNLATNAKIMTAINAALNKPANYKPTIRFTEEIHQRGTERFDFYDLNTYKKTMPSGKLIIIPARMTYETPDVKAFHKKLNKKLVEILQLTGLAKADYDLIEDVNGNFDNKISGYSTINLTWEEAITQQVPYHVPAFVDPNDFLSTESANTTAGSNTKGSKVIQFKSKWIEDVDPSGNPHIYTSNFMNQNGYQPNTASDYEKMGQAMDAVDTEINALQTDNLTPKPNVKSAASKAATGNDNGTTGGGK